MYTGKHYRRKGDDTSTPFTVLQQDGSYLLLDNGARCKIETLLENYMELNPEDFFRAGANAFKQAATAPPVQMQAGQADSRYGYVDAPTSSFINDGTPPPRVHQTPLAEVARPVEQPQPQHNPNQLGTPLVAPKIYPPQQFVEQDYDNEPETQVTVQRQPPPPQHVDAQGNVQVHVQQYAQQPQAQYMPQQAPESPELAIFRKVKLGQTHTLNLTVDVNLPDPEGGRMMDRLFDTSFIDYLTEQIMLRMANDKDFLRAHVREQIDAYIYERAKAKPKRKPKAPEAAPEPAKKSRSGQRKKKEDTPSNEDNS